MGDKFKKLFSTKSIYEIEKNLFKKNIPGFLLMMKAAYAAFNHLNINTKGEVIILCGKGNNGGDGYGLGALLAMVGREVKIYKVEDPIKRICFGKSFIRLRVSHQTTLTKKGYGEVDQHYSH